MLSYFALAFIITSLLPWTLNLTYVKATGVALWEGLVRISTAPLSDWRAALDRLVFAIGVILLIASFWSPLPASTGGTHDDLKQAIINYQTEHHLAPDGVWGPKTNTLYVKGQ